MRQYDIVTGILLILSITDFTLAAPIGPILVQEKRHAQVDVAYIPKDVITVVEKRFGGPGELEKMWEPLLKTSESGKPEPNPASSIANPEGPEPSCWGDCLDTLNFMFSGDLPMHGPGAPMAYSSYGPHLELSAMQAPQSEGPWINPSAHPEFDLGKWADAENSPPSSIFEKGETSGHAPKPPPTDPPEFPLDDQYQPPDPQAAALYAEKGKAKVSRRSSDTARDARNTAGNTAHRDSEGAARVAARWKVA